MHTPKSPDIRPQISLQQEENKFKRVATEVAQEATSAAQESGQGDHKQDRPRSPSMTTNRGVKSKLTAMLILGRVHRFKAPKGSKFKFPLKRDLYDELVKRKLTRFLEPENMKKNSDGVMIMRSERQIAMTAVVKAWVEALEHASWKCLKGDTAKNVVGDDGKASAPVWLISLVLAHLKFNVSEVDPTHTCFWH